MESEDDAAPAAGSGETDDATPGVRTFQSAEVGPPGPTSGRTDPNTPNAIDHASGETDDHPAAGSGDPAAADWKVRTPEGADENDVDSVDVPPPDNPDANAPWETESPAQVIRRIKRTALLAYVVFVPISLYLGGFGGFLGLTCSAAVTIISFLWLEEIVEVVLQPTPKPRAWRVTFRVFARFALFGVAIAVTIVVARFNAVSVLMGFSIIVVGIFGEALYSLYRSLTQ